MIFNKSKLLIFSLIMLFLTIGASIAQTGSISGLARDKKTGEALPGVMVIIEGTTTGATADFDGKFIINNVRPGSYKLKATYISYSPFSTENVQVSAGKTTSVSIDMSESTVELQEVKVTGVKRTNTEIAMINTTRMSPVVSIAISGQQILRSQDRDASEVIKRLPGTTIIDDRFIVVRGLSQRYNSVWLNNTATPSSEADAKAFSFDVIPASMIENMIIVKSPSPELPADFTGGFVKITTVNLPETNSFFAAYGTGISQGTTFENFSSYQPSPTDWLGFDNKFRSLPAEMPAHLNDYDLATNPDVRNRITDLGRELNKTWTPVDGTAIADQRFSIGFNKRFKAGSQDFGNITSVTYSNTSNYDRILNNNYSIYNYSEDKSSYVDEFEDDQYTRNVKAGIMHNWTWYPTSGSRIEFRNLLNQIGMNRTTERYGREWNNNGRYIRSTELKYMNRTIYSGQLAGQHTTASENLNVDWVAGYSFSNK
nr:TonB-dependent receptor [Bacteroidales bacterium]